MEAGNQSLRYEVVLPTTVRSVELGVPDRREAMSSARQLRRGDSAESAIALSCDRGLVDHCLVGARSSSASGQKIVLQWAPYWRRQRAVQPPSTIKL
jgi:hypothetical protein